MSDTPEGAILQRDKTTYAIVPRTPVGMLSVDILKAITAVIEKYEIPIVKITSGQRMALVGVTKEQVPQIWEDLGTDIGRATELCVHYAQACPGTAVCKFGVQDSLDLGMALENDHLGEEYPAKVKFGVSGCHFCCGESYVRDIGVFGKKKGWTLIFGGNSGGRPRVGDVIGEDLTKEEVMDLTRKLLQYYRENGKKRERTARFAERVGIDAIKEAVGV